MINQIENQYYKEDAEFLRKRAWDFISKLEKLERELKKSVDEDERDSLQVRISNTRRLLDNYKSEYKAMCREAGISLEMLGTGLSNGDAVSSRRRNTENYQNVDLPPLFLVPSRNPMFLGRQDTVREFVQQVLKGGAFAISGFKGMGGIGKTEIAKEVCHIFHETWQKQPSLPENLTDLLGQKESGFFRDGIFWIQFHPEGQTPKTLTDDLIFLLIKKCSEASKDIKNLNEVAKLNLDTLADALAGKDVLVVLDNVEQNLRTFDYVLERFKGCFRLLITSRIAIPGIKSIDINVLTDEEAETLFFCRLENQELDEEEREIVRELCKLLGNHPLSITIIASRVKKDNSKLAELLKEYEDNRVHLLDECNDNLCIDQRHVDVRTCFRMSFESLDEEQRRIFLHTALFDNPFAVESLAALLDNVDATEIGHIVNLLERLSLVNHLHGKNGRTAYELHPLMREFALDLLMQPVSIILGKKEKIRTLLKDLQQWKKDNILLEKLRDERSLVRQAIEAVQYCDQVFDFNLVLNFVPLLDWQLDSLICWDERLRLNQLAIRAAVARQQDLNEKYYRKQYADIEKQKAISKNTFDFVGRNKELQYFEEEFLFFPDSFIFNIHTNGDGGFGKTKLLQQMLKLCRSKYADKMISSDELIDFYYTEARSKSGIIEQIISKLGSHHFQNVVQQLKRYRRTKDSSERQYILDDTVTALRKDYAVFAALSERADKSIILFFDTYEAVQFVDKEKNDAESSDFSEWLEKELFPALQSGNTQLVIAGRYPLINVAKESVTKIVLSLFEYEEAVDFLAEYLKVAEFSKDEYQSFLGDFPHAKHLLQPFQDDLEAERIGVRVYEFPNGYRKELGEEVWQALQNKVPVKKEKELLDELTLTKKELETVIKLAGNRPIFLALFMEWVRFSNAEPGKLVREAESIRKEEAQRELFENTIIEWLWNDPGKKKYIYYMTVAYRRMTSEIMQYLTGDSPEHCQKTLLEDIRHFSFTKYKKDETKGDVVLLHDEMRDLIKKRWQNRMDPDQRQKNGILKKLICYYEENLLSPDYILTESCYGRLEQQKVPKNIIDTMKSVTSFFFTKGSFVSALQGQTRLTQDELDKYLPEIVKAAAQEVSHEKREVYTPELIEYAFMIDADDGVRRFCEEFDTVMEDGRPAYANLLGRETEICYKKYGASPLHALQIKLRDAQHYIDSDKQNIDEALHIIKLVNKERQYDESWKASLLCGQFTLWEGIAEFWRGDFEKSLELLEKAKNILISYEGQKSLFFLANNWIGYTLYRKADFAEAKKTMRDTLKELLQWLEQEQHTDSITQRNIQQRIQYAIGNLALFYSYTGNFIKAIRYAETAHNIVTNLPRNKKETLRSLNTLGHVLAIAGRNIDARFYLEEAKKIYKEIPDRLLGGRIYTNFCQLSYGAMEFSHLIEYYRAEELHKALEHSHCINIQEYIDYAEKAIQLFEKEPIFHKELADAYFSLGELYMMMPEKHIKEGDKWVLAEQEFKKALHSARKSQFQYSVIDTLESLVTLYYFQSHAGEKLPSECKSTCEEKQKKYQNEIENSWNIKLYPNLAGRYELTQGDIYFDNALEFLREGNSQLGAENLIKAFNHYIQSAVYKKKFNVNRYYLLLWVIYNRLDKLVELAYPFTFSRLKSLDYNFPKEEFRPKPLISKVIIGHLEQEQAEWNVKVEDFSRIFEYALLLGKKKIEQEALDKLEDELAYHERTGAYWKAVLVNKCLSELYWIQTNVSKKAGDHQKEEAAEEQLVLHLDQQSRQYRLMGDSYHARQAYERAEKIIQQISNPRLKKGVKGYTEIVKGEYSIRRAEFANLLESLVADELEAGCGKFEKQFPGALKEAGDLFRKGQELLEQALQGDCWKNLPLHNSEPYQKKLAEAYFLSGESFILQGQFFEAFNYLEKCMEKCSESEDESRLDGAKQSYLTALYFSDNYDNPAYQEKIKKYRDELEEKIRERNYPYPWVAARFRITQGDILFSKYYRIADETVSADSSSYKFILKEKVERKDIVQIFRKYIEACNYKACYNDLSFEAGLRVLRRRIEMIPDSGSLDILRDVFETIWKDGERLQEKKEERKSILEFIRMRSLVLQYEE
jgi:tetratricopeptide (TPR) repeat protein